MRLSHEKRMDEYRRLDRLGTAVPYGNLKHQSLNVTEASQMSTKCLVTLVHRGDPFMLLLAVMLMGTLWRYERRICVTASDLE